MRPRCAFVDCMYEKDSNKKLNTELETKKIIEYDKIVNGFKLDNNLIDQADDIWAEVQGDVNVCETKAPSDLQENILKNIREKDEERARTNLSDEDKELLELGMIYKKRRKGRKYLVLVAAVVMMLALGITSVGEGEKIFEKVSQMVFGRQQTGVHSDDVTPETDVTEEEVLQEIEDKYGVLPVRMTRLPDGIGFQEVLYTDDLQGVSLYYGTKDDVDILYMIRPDFRNGSWGQNMEDELVEEYELIVSDVRFQVKQYMLSNDTLRWVIRFEYQGVAYSLMINRYDKAEVERIIQNMYFP